MSLPRIEDDARIREAICNFARRNPRSSVVSRPHFCSEECTITEEGKDVYVCQQSHAIHLCGDFECDRMVVGTDRRVCPLTAQTAPLFDECLKKPNQDQRSVSYKRMKIEEEEKKDNTDLTIDVGPSKLKRARSQQLLLSPVERIEKEAQRAMEREKSYRYLMAELGKLGKLDAAFTNHETTLIIEIAEYVWQLIWNHSKISTLVSSTQYLPEYHLLAVLQHTLGGLYIREGAGGFQGQLIPSLDFCRSKIPHLKLLKSIALKRGEHKKIDIGAITVAQKTLARALISIDSLAAQTELSRKIQDALSVYQFTEEVEQALV